MVLKTTVLGGIKPVVLGFLKKPFLHILMLWARPRVPAVVVLDDILYSSVCCLDSDDVEALVDGQLELAKC